MYEQLNQDNALVCTNHSPPHVIKALQKNQENLTFPLCYNIVHNPILIYFYNHLTHQCVECLFLGMFMFPKLIPSTTKQFKIYCIFHSCQCSFQITHTHFYQLVSRTSLVVVNLVHSSMYTVYFIYFSFLKAHARGMFAYSVASSCFLIIKSLTTAQSFWE